MQPSLSSIISLLLSISCLNIVTAQPNLGPQLSEVISEQNVRFTECNNFIKTCAPTISSCASVICAQCTGLGQKGLNACCTNSGPAPAACLGTALLLNGGNANGGNAAAATSFAAATTGGTITDPNALACETGSALIQSCEAATSGFDNLPDSDAASCLCYSGSTWQPSYFDGLYSSCVAYISTADPSDYSSAVDGLGMCQSVGNIRSAPSVSAGPITSRPVSVGGPVVGTAAVAGSASTAGIATEAATAPAAGTPTASPNSKSGAEGVGRPSVFSAIGFAALVLWTL